jgi:hypothetical protein
MYRLYRPHDRLRIRTLCGLVLIFALVSLPIMRAQSMQVESGSAVPDTQQPVEATPLQQDPTVATANTNPAEAGKFTLSGTVVNSVTGEPIRRALVQMNGRVEASVLTDFEGSFKFEGLAAGTTYLTARKPGFFAEQELNNDAGPPLSVEVGPNAGTVSLKLVPEGTISGKVVDAEGQPVEDLPVVVYVQRIMDGTKHRVQQNRTTTDADGHFKIATLQPGTYFLAAGPGSGFPRRRRRIVPTSRDEGFPQVFYPASPELISASPINVSPGQDSEADFSIRTEQMYRVAGTVAGFTPGMSMGLQVQTNAGEYLPMRHFLDNRTGDFRAQLLAGSYRLHMTAQSEGQVLAANVPLMVNSDIADLAIVLSPTVNIPVVIRSDGGNGTSAMVSESTNAGSTASLRAMRFLQHAQQASVRLSSGDTFAGGRDFWASPGDDAKEPALAVRNVEPGTYSVEINTNGSYYVQAASCGDTDLLREDLRIAPGAHPPPIQVTLRSDPGTISGKVQSGGQPSKAGVLLIPDRGGANKAQSTSTGQDGEFQFGLLAPGDYRVLAFDHIDKLEYRNPDVLEAYLSRASRVTVQASDTAKTTVEMIVTGQ